MALEKDLLKAIRENMPEMVAADLAQYIEEAKQTKKEHEDLKKNYETLFSDFRTLDTEYKKMQDQNTAMKIISEAWENKAEDITRRERDLEINDLKKDLQCAQTVTAVWAEVTGQFLKNTIVRESIQRAMVVKNPDFKDYSSNIPLGGGDRVEPVIDTNTKTTE